MKSNDILISPTGRWYFVNDALATKVDYSNWKLIPEGSPAWLELIEEVLENEDVHGSTN